MLDDIDYVTATDLKQYSYCPRIFYYMHCLPRVRPITYKMEAGIEEHEAEQKRSLRRSLSKFEVEGKGIRRFDVAITDAALGVRGLIDEVVTTERGETFPADYKMSGKPGEHFKQQVALYALMLEHQEGITVQRGFLYLIPSKEMIEVKIGAIIRQTVQQQLQAMHQIIVQEAMPVATEKRARCIDCEFRRFCNDVL